MLAVVRDEHVVADESAKLGPHLGERARILDVAIRVAVDRARPRRDRLVRLDQRVKPLNDLALDDPYRAELDDTARGDVAVGRFQVEGDVALERGVELPRVQQLERLEQGERGSDGGWGGSGGRRGWDVTDTSRWQNPPQRDLQPLLRLDHDVLLRGDRRREPLGEAHRVGAIGGGGEAVVALLQPVAGRPDALRTVFIVQARPGR